MLSLTVCIMTRDEERNLPRCLASLRALGASQPGEGSGLSDQAVEVIVLDSHSQDRTRELAEEAGAVVLEEDWRGMNGQRARCLELGSGDWVLCLDADEWLEPELARSLARALVEAEPGVDGFELNRRTLYLGGWIDHCGWSPEWRLRLVRRARGCCTGTDPHDRIKVAGAVLRLDLGRLNHEPYRSLAAHVGKVNRYTDEMAQQRVARGEDGSVFKLWTRPVGRFLRMYVLRAGWRDGWRGLVLSAVGGFYVFLKYAKLRELNRREPAS